MTIAERFKTLREALKLTQTSMAQELGVDRSHIGNIESGTKKASESLIKHVCVRYDVSETWLKTGEGEMFISPKEVIKKHIIRFGKTIVLKAVLDAIKELEHSSLKSQDEENEENRSFIYHILHKVSPEIFEQYDASEKTHSQLDRRGIEENPTNASEAPWMQINSLNRNNAPIPLDEHRAPTTGDPELDRMINILFTFWTCGDLRLRGWASFQFDRAFPEDVVEEVQKKQKETSRQANVV